MRTAAAPLLGLVVAAAVVALCVAHDSRTCTRTWKGREHLHPNVHKLPPPTDDELDEMRSLPRHLDWCERGMCTPSWNQHIPVYCGSCFAHGALASVNDRIKILHHTLGWKRPDVMMGRQSFLNCAPGHGLSHGCKGGEPADVYEFMRVYGLPDETCLHYNATDYTKYITASNPNGTCPPEGYCIDCMKTPDSPEAPVCFPVSQTIRYRAKEYWRLSGEHAMMKELQHGPITCGMACSNEFVFNYTAGIFRDKTNFTELDHDVEIVGYGEDSHGVKYWHVRNSWGTYWGENGFFKIVRGENNLVIESDCHAMVPDVADDVFVWDEMRPAYGGSIYGLRPYDRTKIASIERTLGNTSYIAWNNTQRYTYELLHKPKHPMPMKLGATASSTWGQLAVVAVVAGAVGIVAGVVGMNCRHAVYERIA